MGLISEETVKQFAAGAESLAKVTAGVSTELMNEAINLFLVESALNILKFASVFVVFYIVKRYFDVMMEANKSKEALFKGLKTTALVVSIIFFSTQSFPHLVEMSKALVAPKIFLIEKGSELIKGK